MPYRRPTDYAGAWWHITNRGIAKRPVFEGAYDIEQFLDLLVAEVTRGRLELHAYAVLTTHVHLLVRSPRGELSRAMRAVFRGYVGWFNRARKRDGALFRGRFKARLIEDSIYWENVLRYIDLNPVEARMSLTPSAYPFGSARHYVSPQRPGWLSTETAEGVIAEYSTGRAFRREEYDRFSMSADEELVRQFVELRLDSTGHARTVPLTNLIEAASRRQRSWFEWKAELADGVPPGVVVVPTTVLDRVVSKLPEHLRSRRTLRAGLLRELSALAYVELAERLGCTESAAYKATRRHANRCARDPEYREVVARVIDIALRRLPRPRDDALRARRGGACWGQAGAVPVSA